MAMTDSHESGKESAWDIKTNIISKRLCVGLVLIICILLFSYKTSHLVEDKIPMFTLKRRPPTIEKCDFNKTVIRRVKFPFRGISIEVSGKFLDRVRAFNSALDQLRLTHWSKKPAKEWKNISAMENITLINGGDDNFLQQLENYSQIETVFLPWIHEKGRAWTSLEDTSNILLNVYFEWTADRELCQWINTPGISFLKYEVMYNRICISDIQKTERPQSLRVLALNSKPLLRDFYWPNNGTRYPPYFYDKLPTFAFYLHVIQDCVVTSNSEVWSGSMYLAPSTCIYSKNKGPPRNVNNIPLYDEVISLTQQYGHAVFHKMIEVIPRLSLYIDFLKRNPQVRILVSEVGGRTAELLSLLGFASNRIITGTCRAKVLYFPRTTMCVDANIQEIQVLSKLYKNYMKEKLKTESRDKIILVKRTGSRQFTEQAAIERMIKETAAFHNLSFSLFPDNPVPSLSKTMIMFYSAVMVIAPHGAGLANIIFSQPGTYIIEGVCQPPRFSLCFQRLSNVLGHHWHGIHSDGGGCQVINVSISAVKVAVERHLELLKV